MIPVTKSFIPPIEEYTKQVERAFKNEWLTNRGELVRELEAKLINYLGLFINFYFVGKIVNNHWFVYVKYMAKPFLLALLMGLVVYSITYLPLNSYVITLFLQMITGFVFYIGVSKIFDIVEYRYLKDIVLEQSAKFSIVNKILRKII